MSGVRIVDPQPNFGGASPSGKATDFDSVIGGLRACFVGSNPTAPANIDLRCRGGMATRRTANPVMWVRFPPAPPSPKYQVNFKDLLRENTWDDDGDDLTDDFVEPGYTPDEEDEFPQRKLTPEENPDVWSRDAIEEVAGLVNSKFQNVPESLRRSLIAWVKATDDLQWMGTLDKIAAAIQCNPSVMNKLQGCRSLTQAKHFALAVLGKRHAGFDEF